VCVLDIVVGLMLLQLAVKQYGEALASTGRSVCACCLWHLLCSQQLLVQQQTAKQRPAQRQERKCMGSKLLHHTHNMPAYSCLQAQLQAHVEHHSTHDM
jgi:hypothetical protein